MKPHNTDPVIQAEHDLFTIGMVCKMQDSDDHRQHLRSHQRFLLSKKWIQIMAELDDRRLHEIELHMWRHASAVLVAEMGYDPTPPPPE